MRQRDHRPHADGVVPVEVARLAGEAAAEPDDLLDRAPGPGARDPEVGARQDEEQEGEVGGAGDRAAGRPVVAAGRQPAVPVGDAAEEGADAGIAAAEQPAGVGIGVGDDALADGQRDRRRGIPPHRDGARLADQPGGPDAGEQRVNRQRRRGRRRRQADVAGVGVVDELLLERQQDAGRRHDEHDDPGERGRRRGGARRRRCGCAGPWGRSRHVQKTEMRLISISTRASLSPTNLVVNPRLCQETVRPGGRARRAAGRPHRPRLLDGRVVGRAHVDRLDLQHDRTVGLGGRPGRVPVGVAAETGPGLGGGRPGSGRPARRRGRPACQSASSSPPAPCRASRTGGWCARGSACSAPRAGRDGSNRCASRTRGRSSRPTGSRRPPPPGRPLAARRRRQEAAGPT